MKPCFSSAARSVLLVSLLCLLLSAGCSLSESGGADASPVPEPSLPSSSETPSHPSPSVWTAPPQEDLLEAPQETPRETPQAAPHDSPPPSQSVSPVFIEVDEIVYATASVNIRAGDSADSERLGGLSIGDPVTRIGIGENGWSQIAYQGGIAYVSSDYLSLTKPAVRNTTLYVLMMHHFVPDGTDCNDWMLTESRLRETLQWLSDHGYTTVLPSQIIRGDPLPDKAVLLSLDDGYASNYTIAYPLFQEFQAKAVISLLTSRIEDGNPDYLTWDMCHEMAQSGLVEFGSHTHDLHQDAPLGIKRIEGESRESYEARVFSDLQTSIDLIHSNLDRPVQFFAYPSGQTDAWAEGFLREHFSMTVTTRHGAADLSKGFYQLYRMNISMRESVDLFLN